MRSLQERLANEYLLSLEEYIDHGLDEPRPGGFSIVRDLKEDLDKEQKEVLKDQDRKDWSKEASDRGDLDKERPDVDPVPLLVKQVFQTADLYQEMSEADDIVSVERSAILKVESAATLADATPCTEHYYSAKVMYHINIAMLLMNSGVPDIYADETASTLGGLSGEFSEYIERNGSRDLLDKWLPGKPTDLDYELKWEVVSVTYSSFARLDVLVKTSERWLTLVENA